MVYVGERETRATMICIQILVLLVGWKIEVMVEVLQFEGILGRRR
jgi:hypothetical protein